MQGTLLIPACNQHGRQNQEMITSNNNNNMCKRLIWNFILFILLSNYLCSASPQYNGDVTPEDYVIDQLAALLQQHHLRQQQEAADAEIETEVGGTGGGPGFSYQFPPLPGGRESQHEPYFAVNPSDPRYYLPPQAPAIDQSDDDFLADPASWADIRRQQEERGLRGPNPGDGGIEIRGGGRAVLPHFPALLPSDLTPEDIAKIQPNLIPNMMLKAPKRPTKPPPTQERVGIEDEDEEHEALPLDQAMRILQEPVKQQDDIYFAAIVAGCSAAGVVTVIAVGLCWYKLQRNAKAAADVEYPAYGVTGPNKDPSPTSGDRRLAQSAQMYHYQHQKQQIIAMESRAANDRRGSMSEAESDEENEEGDYTVYECPGLAPTGEMEVKNPLFLDDPTPASPATPRSDEKSSESGKKSPASGSK